MTTDELDRLRAAEDRIYRLSVGEWPSSVYPDADECEHIGLIVADAAAIASITAAAISALSAQSANFICYRTQPATEGN